MLSPFKNPKEIQKKKDNNEDDKEETNKEEEVIEKKIHHWEQRLSVMKRTISIRL